jgi:hypothetical protein
MAKVTDAERQLAGFMARFTDEVAFLADAILCEMRRLYPTALELVYDNYNALAIGFGPTERASEAIFSIALFPRWVSLFFLQAKGLPDPEKILRGSGSVARHIVLPSAEMLHHPAVQDLMREATVRAKVPFDSNGAHRLIIKSISATQRPRQPAAKSATRAVSPEKKSMGKKAPAGAKQK